MFARTMARTGIDIGTARIKLVRGEGKRSLERLTHFDSEPWDGSDRQKRVAHAAEALSNLLQRNGLRRRKLGRIVASCGWQEHAVREVSLPRLSQEELNRALPFEAPNHLDLEGLDQPVLAGQVLGPDPEDTSRVRVLFAAVPRVRRDFVLDVLRACDLIPEIVDLEALAGLNSLLQQLGDTLDDETPVGLLDLGGRHTALHISSRRGGLLSRNVAPGAPADPSSPAEEGYLMKLVSGVRQTLTYYRSRERHEVAALYLIGGGSTVTHRAENLRQATGLPVAVHDPLPALSGGAIADQEEPVGPLYATACGLCLRGDDEHV